MVDPRDVKADAAADKARRKALRPWYKKKRFIIPLALFVLFILGTTVGDPDADDDPPAASPTGESELQIPPAAPEAPAPAPAPAPPPAAKQYVEVTRLSGTSEKRGGTFALSGSDAKLIYESQADILGVYIMEKGDILEEQGGFTEVTCLDACNDETQLAKSGGEYYLEVKASGGAWTVVVQELR